ncbi:CNNM domain-containing protein [Anaeromassilibacillus sp. SJQ-1]|uniref:CNNM domain-containing protein n=1 Tax=Anaeromassilibacillus sp. SJQ-1 TaxID=3375419 RepID=UPI003989937C
MVGADFGIVIGIVICVLFSGYFSAWETAFTTLNRIRMKTAAESGREYAVLRLRLLFQRIMIKCCPRF